MLRFSDLNLAYKRVVIREDFNVPMQEGGITSDTRLKAALPTIQAALKQNAAVILLSHLGRPQEGQPDPTFSLEAVANRLSQLLSHPVVFVKNYLNGALQAEPGKVYLCENVRFNVGEKKNDAVLAKQYAALGDVYVMDAFGTAHRAEASTEGAIHYANTACGGPLLMTELDAIAKVVANPQFPMLAIVAGSKVSTKLALLENIAEKANFLLVGGGILNTFILAAGYQVGKSLCEPDLVPLAQKIQAKMKARQAEIPLPVDVVVASDFKSDAVATVKLLADVALDDMILDIGPQTAAVWSKLIHHAKTIVWNGPVGVFEFSAFAKGTETIARAIADSEAYSIAGGGDTLAAIEQFGVEKNISYISTGGGAFLECLEGKVLPAVAALNANRNARA